LNIVQCRMARTALDWSLQDLADASRVSRRTIARFEAGESVLPARAQALRHAFEAQGILFIDSGHMAGGVIPPRHACPLRGGLRS
jgi:transcriptional regulator with XRE-family HTH domain